MLLEQVDAVRSRGEKARVEVQYKRAVTEEGNPSAQQVLEEVFDVCPAEWREIGDIDESGYAFTERYAPFDAVSKLDLTVPPPTRRTGCICGEIMLGLRLPTDCELFAAACTPRDPVGPCMVSSEGACAAFYKYDRHAPNEGA
jgi:hydrogenase expression/formation protein HypD